MFEFFFTLKKRAGLGNAIMVFGLLRAAPMLLMLVGSPLLVWREEWLNAGMCFLLGFVTLVVGALTEARVKEKAEGAAKPSPPDKSPTPTPPVVAAAPAKKGGMPTCAMPECKRNVEVPKHPLCPECWTDWINKQAQNVFHCAMPGCKNTATSDKRPLCRLCWGKWDKENRSQ